MATCTLHLSITLIHSPSLYYTHTQKSLSFHLTETCCHGNSTQLPLLNRREGYFIPSSDCDLSEKFLLRQIIGDEKWYQMMSYFSIISELSIDIERKYI